jgi:4-amino-4-deoxy-L-arabinose transferase
MQNDDPRRSDPGSHPDAPVRRRRRLAATAAALALAYALAFQGSRGLWETDEGRYTAIALQMLRSGDFLVPAFNDEVAHFAKPPLTYWAIAGGMALLGRNEWGARLANALAFAATLLAAYGLGRRMLPGGRAWVAPFVYGTCLLPYVAAHAVTTDTLLTLWEAAAVLAFAAWWTRRGGRLRLLAMWTAFGAAFLTKGPPGLLPLLGIAVFVVLAAGRRELRRMFRLPELAAFAAVGLGWYAVVALMEPGLMSYFLRDEVARRVASSHFDRHAQWYGAFRVYAPVLLAGTLPWTHLLLGRVREARRTLLARRWWREVAAGGDPWPVLLACWFLIPLLVFALSSSRLELYILPLWAPLALVVARRLAARPSLHGAVRLGAASAVALVLLRAYAAGHATDRDARAAARELLALAEPAPREIVFYDAKPIWGLSLYLDCTIERIRAATDTDAPPDGTSAETLLTELVDRSPRRLLLAPPARRDEVAAALARAGLPYRELGTFRGRLLIAAGDDLHPAGSTPP